MKHMVEPVIVSDLDIMNGTPCSRGTRVLFSNLIAYLEGGHPLGEFLRQFPTITRDMAVKALEEAKASLLARIARRCFWTSACPWISATNFWVMSKSSRIDSFEAPRLNDWLGFALTGIDTV